MLERYPVREMGRRGGEDIAPMEGLRDGWAEIARGLQDHGRPARSDPREKPVVRADEQLPARLEGERGAGRAHARIDDRNEHRSLGKMAGCLLEKKSPGADVLGRHSVRYVDDVGLGGDAGEHAFHDPHVRIVEAEVGQQRDDRSACHVGFSTVK